MSVIISSITLQSYIFSGSIICKTLSSRSRTTYRNTQDHGINIFDKSQTEKLKYKQKDSKYTTKPTLTNKPNAKQTKVTKKTSTYSRIFRTRVTKSHHESGQGDAARFSTRRQEDPKAIRPRRVERHLEINAPPHPSKTPGSGNIQRASVKPPCALARALNPTWVHALFFIRQERVGAEGRRITRLALSPPAQSFTFMKLLHG